MNRLLLFNFRIDFKAAFKKKTLFFVLFPEIFFTILKLSKRSTFVRSLKLYTFYSTNEARRIFNSVRWSSRASNKFTVCGGQNGRSHRLQALLLANNISRKHFLLDTSSSIQLNLRNMYASYATPRFHFVISTSGHSNANASV